MDDVITTFQIGDLTEEQAKTLAAIDVNIRLLEAALKETASLYRASRDSKVRSVLQRQKRELKNMKNRRRRHINGSSL